MIDKVYLAHSRVRKVHVQVQKWKQTNLFSIAVVFHSFQMSVVMNFLELCIHPGKDQLIKHQEN